MHCFARRCSAAFAEGAGAAGLALSCPAGALCRSQVGLVLCGGNIDARMLASVMVRELEREQRHHRAADHGSGPAGAARQARDTARDLGANILEVQHGRLFLDVPAKGVTVESRWRRATRRMARRFSPRSRPMAMRHDAFTGAISADSSYYAALAQCRVSKRNES